MDNILARALASTAPLWPDVETGARWVREASAILANPGKASARTVRRHYRRWIGQLERSCCDTAMSAPLREAAHFVKVTRSYGKDLFHCYQVTDMPRTNNALEQAFGSLRYHERRASGRKVVSPSLVPNGCARMATAAATRTVTRDMLAAVPHARWRATLAELERRRQARCQRFRFRQHPKEYLAGLEEACGKLIVSS